MGPKVLWLAGALALAAPAGFAQEEKPRLEWGLGLGVIASPRPYQGTKAQLFAVPVVNVKRGPWFFHGIRGGYEVISTERFTASAFGQARFQGLEPEESPYLEGMETRSKSLDAGAEILFRGRPVGFRIAASTDVLGRSNGQEISAQLVTGAPLGRELLLLVGFGPRWESARRVDYYYGVRPDEARDFRPSYAGEATVSWDLGLSALYRPTSRWSVFVLVNRTGYGDGIGESPIVARGSASTLIASVVRELGSTR
jgi:outer membrane protein